MDKNNFSEDWSAYTEYNKVLRAWFVAFGIGVPATFLINDELTVYISPGIGKPHLFFVFLIGAAAQVLMAFLNKMINWCSYYKKRRFPDVCPTGCGQKCADILSRASDWYLIDVVFDLITIGCFAYAIVNLFFLIIATGK